MSRKSAFVLLLHTCFAVVAQSCATTARQFSAQPTRPTLSARFVDPRNVELAWRSSTAGVGGWFVEFRVGDEPEFNILDILPAERTTYVHPNVALETAFTYRVVPILGEASNVASVASVASVATGTATQPTSPELESEGPIDDVPGMPQPSELKATLVSPTSVDLRWPDRAAGEEGYLVEISASRDSGFVACALLPQDARSFRKARLPVSTSVHFRVRAFTRGPASNTVTVTAPRSIR